MVKSCETTSSEELTLEELADIKTKALELFNDTYSRNCDALEWRAVHPELINLFPKLDGVLHIENLARDNLMAFDRIKEKLEKQNQPPPEIPPIPDSFKEIPHPADLTTNSKITPQWLKRQVKDLIELCKKKGKSPEEKERLLRESKRLSGQLETFSS